MTLRLLGGSGSGRWSRAQILPNFMKQQFLSSILFFKVNENFARLEKNRKIYSNLVFVRLKLGLLRIRQNMRNFEIF